MEGLFGLSQCGCGSKKEDLKGKESDELSLLVEKLDKFPGSLEEYSLLKGRKYEIIDTGKQEKYVADRVGSNAKENTLLKELLDNGCVALIWYGRRPSASFHGFSVPCGVPVKEKK